MLEEGLPPAHLGGRGSHEGPVGVAVRVPFYYIPGRVLPQLEFITVPLKRRPPCTPMLVFFALFLLLVERKRYK